MDGTVLADLVLWGLGILGFFGLVACAFRRFELFFLPATSGAWILLTWFLLDLRDQSALIEQPLPASLLLVGGIAVAVILGQSAINRFISGFFALCAISMFLWPCAGSLVPLVALVAGIVGGVLAIRTEEARHFCAGATCLFCCTPGIDWFAGRVLGDWDFVFTLPLAWALGLLAGYAAYQQARHQGLFSQVDNESPRTHSTLE